jgi:capsular exopolysaccharide synthesis family protein
MAAPTKGGGYYTYNNTKKQTSSKMSITGHGKQTIFVGSDISFAAAEAYKLLRTKLQFSFADDNDCRIIGVSSALSGEGKSLSAINLAHTLSQLDKRTLLIDCDMRRPSLSTKLPIVKVPGLSNYLSGQSTLENLFQYCGIKNEEEAFTVIAAGRNPPNPVELLTSAKMGNMLQSLRKAYDYIILDLPPVGEVSDALAVAKYTDGVLLVARQNYGNRIEFTSAVRQFEFIDARILGVIYNCATENAGAYGKRYYKRYYRRYEGSYASTKRHAEKVDIDYDHQGM